MLGKPIQRILLPMAFLAISTVLSAQGAWLSAWGGGGLRVYDKGKLTGSEWVTGIRFGPDLSPKLRVMLGVEYGESIYRLQRTSLLLPASEETFSYRERELLVHLLFAFRLAGNEKQETRLIIGGEFGEAALFQVERRFNGPVGTSVESAQLNASHTTGGLRLGLRHARALHGPLWLFVEPWASVALEREPTVSSPWPNERYLDLPKRAGTLGLILGLELGPRSAKHPE